MIYLALAGVESMRIIHLIATVVFTLPLLGCMVPYAYPKVDYTMPIKVECPGEEVHAFRVDITQHRTDVPARDATVCLTELPLNGGGEIPAQKKSSVTYGFYVFAVALDLPVETNHDVHVRVYRPGFELVEIASWQPPECVDWKRAPDLKTQAEVLHSLVWMAEPGSASPANRAALLFAASEYERLAALAPPDYGKDTLKSRLMDEARELRKRADE
jgi:hypothetical protein